MERKCLYCYKPLNGKETDFHARCSRKMFGTEKPPVLPYAQDQIRAMAEEVIRSQTTLTGVQPKLSLDFDRMSRTPRLTIVGLWGRFILKPQTERYPFLPELEDLTMHLAQLAGVETVPHSLIRFADGQLCYITRRIDRTPQGEKIHMEDKKAAAKHDSRQRKSVGTRARWRGRRCIGSAATARAHLWRRWRSCKMASMLSCAQLMRLSIQGRSERPRAVSSYSTRGGTSG